MDDEQTIKASDTNPVEMYETTEVDPSDNKENIVLRTLVGDPNRYTPLVDHRPPSMLSAEEQPPSRLYTRDTQYQPIPAKALPNRKEPKVYYVGSNRLEEAPVSRENRDMTPTIFLEPKVVSQPVVYSLTNTKTTPMTDRPISIQQEPPNPTVYSMSNRPRRPTINLITHTPEVPTSVIDKSPTVYSLANSPRIQQFIQEPPKHLEPPSPNLYSIVGTPARTSRGVQVDPMSPPQAVPILYTIVDEPINKSKETRPLPPPTQKSKPKDMTVYTIDHEKNFYPAEQPIPKPTLYALVARPISPPHDKLPTRKRTPPFPATITTRRISRHIEQKPIRIVEEIIPPPISKSKHYSQSKEATNPRSEVIIIPLHDEESRTRPHQPGFHPIPEQTYRKQPPPSTQDQNQFSNYRSGYRTQKPYRERKFNNNPLPVVGNQSSERKPRPPLYEPRYRVERHHPYVATKPTSLERNPVQTKGRFHGWNPNGYQTQTDDEDDYDRQMYKTKRNFPPIRSRAPWIPVW